MITNYILDRLLLIKDLKAIKEMLVSIKGNFKKKISQRVVRQLAGYGTSILCTNMANIPKGMIWIIGKQ